MDKAAAFASIPHVTFRVPAQGNLVNFNSGMVSTLFDESVGAGTYKNGLPSEVCETNDATDRMTPNSVTPIDEIGKRPSRLCNHLVSAYLWIKPR